MTALTELLILMPGLQGSRQLLVVQMALGDLQLNLAVTQGSQARISSRKMAIWTSNLETWGCQVMCRRILGDAR